MGLLDTINDSLKPGGLDALGRTLANTALGQIPGFSSPEIVSQNIQDIYGYFLTNLLQSSNSIPLKPLWLCFLDEIPNTIADAQSLDLSYSAEQHDLALGHTASRSGIDMRGAKAAMLVQECQTPGESFGVTRASSSMGGFVNGGTSSTRTSFEPAKIAFLETNYSFTDFVLRPWLITASYQSLKMCKKTNITMINFAKAGKDVQFKPRKIIKLFNCVPISIESEGYTYSGNDVIRRETTWHYDSYTVKSGQYIVERELLSSLDRVFNTDTDFNTIKQSGLTAASGLIANTLTNLAGNLGSAVEERLGITSNRSVAGANRLQQRLENSGVISPQINDHIISSPESDDIIPPKNDTPVIRLSELEYDNTRRLDDVVSDQIATARRGNNYQEILPLEDDTPITGRTYNPNSNADIVPLANDTPIFGAGVKDDVKVDENDYPVTYKNNG